MAKKSAVEPASHGFQLVLHDPSGESFTETFAAGSVGSRPSRSRAELIETRRLQEIMEQYISYYAAGGSHTARAKRYDLEHFLGFLGSGRGGPGNVLVSDWTLQSTKDFIADRLKHGEAPATVSRRLATLKHFGRTIAERLPGYINPAREAKGPSSSQIAPKGLSPDQIRRLQEAASELAQGGETELQRFSGLRNQLLVELLLGTGLRADEVRLLTVGQLSADQDWLRNVQTKGKKFRNVYVPGELRPLITQYLGEREAVLQRCGVGGNEPGGVPLARFPLLISVRGANPQSPESFGLNAKTIWRIIADIGLRAAEKPGETIHPHLLRHTFAHGLLDSSKDVRLVAQALGHSDVRTTMRYTERSDTEIANAVERQRKNGDSGQ